MNTEHPSDPGPRTLDPARKNFPDRLTDACLEKGPVCVGLDPVLERLPASLRASAEDGQAVSAARAIARFCRGVLEAVAPQVGCVKIQSACFERYLWPGVEVYYRLIEHARSLGLIVIADVKRGDIGTSSNHYAAGHLAESDFSDLGSLGGPDAVTLSPYLGADALEPFIQTAATHHKGLFVLVRTSNPGSDSLQRLPLADGRTVAQAFGDEMARLGSADHLVGSSGYSLLGAVVGATKSHEMAELRARMGQQIFLVPGFGAQGGSAADVKAAFKSDGSGAMITASRSVVYAFEQSADDWQTAVANAARKMGREIRSTLES